jgi:hypothetical protein
MKDLSIVVDSRVKRFQTKFSELRLALPESDITQTEITAWRVLGRVEYSRLYFPLCVVFSNVAHGICRCETLTR